MLAVSDAGLATKLADHRRDDGRRVTRHPQRARGALRAAAMAELGRREHKIVLERQLWIAVLAAQRELGSTSPTG